MHPQLESHHGRAALAAEDGDAIGRKSQWGSVLRRSSTRKASPVTSKEASDNLVRFASASSVFNRQASPGDEELDALPAEKPLPGLPRTLRLDTGGIAGVKADGRWLLEAAARSGEGTGVPWLEGIDVLDEQLQEFEGELHAIFGRFTRMQREHLELVASFRARCLQAQRPAEQPRVMKEESAIAGRRSSGGKLSLDILSPEVSPRPTTRSRRTSEGSAASVPLDGVASEGDRFRMTLEGREARRREAASACGSDSVARVTPPPGRKSRLLRWVNSNAFQYIVCMAVLISSAIVGAEVNYTATHTGKSHLGFLYMDIFFMTVFVIELLLRSIAHQWELFALKNMFVTAYDIFVVVSMFVNICVSLVDIPDNISGVLRLFRVARCLRLMRVVRFVRPLRHLLHSIFHTTKSFFWAFALLMTLILFCFGVVFAQAVSDYWHASGSAQDNNRLIKYWGTLPKAMFTLFMSITGGVDWTEVVEDLVVVGQFWVALFTFYIAFIVLAVLNVVTGVFCQSAVESAQNDKELATMELMNNTEVMNKKLTKLFREIDADGSGVITIDELEETLHEKRSQAYLRSLGIDAADAWTLVKLLDVDETGSVDLDEFISGCMGLKGEARAVHIATLAYDQRQMCKALEEFMDSVDTKLTDLVKASRHSGISKEGAAGSAERHRAGSDPA